MDSLQETEKLIIRQKFEALEALANAAANALNVDALGALGETANKYDVFTDDGGDKYRVIESSEYCGLTGRCCCAPNHKLQLHVFHPEENKDSAIMMFDRPCKCGQCCSVADICRQEMTVYEGAGEGNQISYIKQPFLGGGLSPTLHVMDRDGEEPIATIKANAVCCIGGLCCDHTFEVSDADGNSIGRIVKTKPDSLGQLASELVSDADVFALEFNDKALDVKKKASMFAALHLIDYMFFENEGELNLDAVNGKCSFKCCDMFCCGCVCPCVVNCGGGDDDDGDGGGGDYDGGGGDDGGGGEE
jgi:hypothetical protein